MATAELASATERAVLARVRARLPKLEHGCRLLGIRAAGEPRWDGPREVEVEGTPVRIAPCTSVLAVLDALATAESDAVTVVYTDLPESELGDAVLARLHRGELLHADRNTQLDDELGTRAIDPRIRREPWLVDALLGLAAAGHLGGTAAAGLSRHRAIALVAAARLGRDPDQADLPALVEAFDDTRVRFEWRARPAEERQPLVKHLRERHGPGITVVAALAEEHDDLLALLLVAQVLTAAPDTDTRAATALGGFLQVRFAAPRPGRDDLAAAGVAAVEYARTAPPARVNQQARIAEAMLEELSALSLVAASPILPRAFAERLALAAESLDPAEIDALAGHFQAADNDHRIGRVASAGRLRRWLASAPAAEHSTATDAVRHHARELAWVDRALRQVRAGDPDPRVAGVLQVVEADAARVRAELDLAFARRLAVTTSTPEEALAVETLLPVCVAPLARQVPVLLVVLDGMSEADAGELTDHLAGRHTGWTEITRCADGGREAVLAALPTETAYSRTSLFSAGLRAGDQASERAAFPNHRFWPPGGAAIVHKAGVAGRHGFDLGPDLEAAVAPDGARVVAVVLNTIDDSLAKGRQSHDPAWRPDQVPGLTPLLDRAAAAGRVVLLTSDHGHVLEHGAEHRHHPGSAARRRPDDGKPDPDEVTIGGPRMLLAEERAIFAATEHVRYGSRAHGYHGGATLAEAAIPLIALTPPGMAVPAGWVEQTLGRPAWWDASAAVPAPASRPATTARPTRKRGAKPQPQGDGLFEVEAPGGSTPGRALVDSVAFQTAYTGIPANVRPAEDVVAAVVDALLDAGGRLPLGGVVAVAGAAGRNPRGLVSVLKRVLNRDSYPVLDLADSGRTVALNRQLLDEQFPPDERAR